MFYTFDFHTKESFYCLSFSLSLPPPTICVLLSLPSLSSSLSHSCLLALPCSVIPPVSRNAVVFNFFQLLWHCARPPAFPHLLPVMPHKHGQHIKTAGSQPSAWPTPGTPESIHSPLHPPPPRCLTPLWLAHILCSNRKDLCAPRLSHSEGWGQNPHSVLHTKNSGKHGGLN